MENRNPGWLWGAAILLLLSFASTVQAADYYGAIAYSRSTGASAYSYDHRSRHNAEVSAINHCGRRDCQAVIWFKNACGALSVGARGAYGTGWGSTRQLAEAYARQSCQKHGGGRHCATQVWTCTTR